MPSRNDFKGGIRLRVLPFLIFSLAYFYASIRISISLPFWMDEVLAVWIARMPSIHALFGALWSGGEFSPPTYHLLLRAMMDLGGDHRLIFRLPSIIASYAAALAVFSVVRRRYAYPVAALSAAFCLSGAMFTFALQARPYAIIAALFAISLWLWDGAGAEDASILRAVCIAISFGLVVSMHFYAGLLAGSLLFMEFLWWVRYRRIRLSLWFAMIAACACALPWIPLMRHLQLFNAGDATAPNYYGKPTLIRLVTAYADLMIGGRRGEAILLIIAGLLAFALLKRRFSSATPSSLAGISAVEPAAAPSRGSDLNYEIMTFTVIAIPLAVFIFAALVTHTFNERYALTGAVGFALLFACAIDLFPEISRIACIALIGASAILLLDIRPALTPGFNLQSIALLRSSTAEPLPIVIGEGLQYLEIEGNAEPRLRQRLVYLTHPAGMSSGDPTNENQVVRWKAIRPDLNIVSVEEFLAHNPRFYLLHLDCSNDAVTEWLLRKGWIEEIKGHRGKIWLFVASGWKNTSPSIAAAVGTSGR